MDKKALGSAIQTKRKALHLKQASVSETTGLSRSYLSDIENGRYAPSVDALSKIAIALNLDLNFLKNDGNTSIQGEGVGDQ
ncbi:helix-turn-helix domain-containing protein [Paenibacillus alkaliterrae]|uniref:helix-turn-helix domain-containing protein n=1 Tax=Paenibacillus alkaliterrae TaxID=320909 RepID=UPI001F1CDA6C|nr:helix-turn-helix transcriptional regulator [Paenibacillus alkaliterrae]MCF2939007.1 helix-turn-helix domain-containing protein [Paenibacillus alkaliterrae]